jgi:netrin-G3 ligand
MATSLSSTDIYVTWEEVPPIDRNGMITIYDVLYEPLETFEVLTSNTVNTTNLSLVLVELHPFVSYNISLRAYTSIGGGPYSDSLLETTHEDRKQLQLLNYVYLHHKLITFTFKVLVCH